MYKKCGKIKHIELLLIGEEGKKHYVLIKHFNTLVYGHTLHRGKNIFAVINYKLLAQKNIRTPY